MSFVFASFLSRGHLLIRFLGLPLLSFLSLLLVSCGGGDGGPSSGPVGVVAASAPSPGISLLAGALGGAGDADGTGTAARFNMPLGAAIDSIGNLYVADTSNHLVRKVTPAGVVSTLAGNAGHAGSVDGSGSAARFNMPYGVAVDAAGNVYVADTGNNTLRKITPAGTVSTLAGTAGSAGSANGNGTAARFNAPSGVVVDAAGNIYVTDRLGHTVRKITPAGDVSTLAGMAGSAGYVDGSSAVARLNSPMGIAIDSTDSLYVTDLGNQVVRQITPTGGVSTVASVTGSLVGVALDGVGNLYVTDVANHIVRKITPSGVVTTLAGSVGNSGTADGTGSSARFNIPVGIAVDAAGNVYVADMYNDAIRAVSAAGVVSTFAGLAPATGTVDDTGALARFNAPGGVAVDSAGNISVADTGNHTVRMITPAGVTTTLAGGAGTSGSTDGSGSVARFNHPHGLAFDPAGNRYVADTGNHVIRKISSSGAVTTLAGSAGAPGTSDGTGVSARFSSPAAIAVDAAGYVYVADTASHTVRKITPSGTVTTLAGVAGSPGTADGTGSVARFNAPAGIVLGLTGSIYVADTANHTVRKITPAGTVTTLAGNAGNPGAHDAAGFSALFSSPTGIAVDADDNLYIADTGNGLLRQVTPSGVVTTLAGVAGSNGLVLGSLPGGLNAPLGLAIGLDGSLYASSENAIVKVTLPTPISRFGISLQASSTSLMLGQSFSLSWYAANAASCQASGGWSGSRAVSGNATITPSSGGTTTYTLTCTESGTAATKSASVTVNTTVPAPAVSITASPSRIAPGESFTLNWSSTNASACTASGGWTGSQAISGSLTFTPAAGTYSYSLACTGAGGSGSASVTVTVALSPVVTLSTSLLSLTQGQSTTLTWSSSNTTFCSASGAWAGSQPLSGTLAVTPSASGNQTYNLSCTGPGGTDSKSLVVTVQPAPAPASGGGSSGGAGDMNILLGLGILAMIRRYFSRP